MDWLLIAFVFFLLSIAVGLLWALIGMATTARHPSWSPGRMGERGMSDIVERLRDIARMKGWGAHAEAADEIERLRAAQAWQPIETAPVNGDRFLLCYRTMAGPYVAECCYEQVRFKTSAAWFDPGPAAGDMLGWMPLPPPPEADT